MIQYYLSTIVQGCIVGYLIDDVSKAASRSSRKKSTENRNENLARIIGRLATAAKNVDC